MGRALKTFVDNRKGIISKCMVLQCKFKTDDLSVFNHDYTWLIRFLMTHLPDLLRGRKTPGTSPQIEPRPRLDVERSLDYISPDGTLRDDACLL